MTDGATPVWLIVAVISMVTLIVYQFVIIRDLREVKSIRDELKSLNRRIAMESQSIGHKVNNVVSGVAMLTSDQGLSWKPTAAPKTERPPAKKVASA